MPVRVHAATNLEVRSLGPLVDVVPVDRIAGGARRHDACHDGVGEACIVASDSHRHNVRSLGSDYGDLTRDHVINHRSDARNVRVVNGVPLGLEHPPRLR